MWIVVTSYTLEIVGISLTKFSAVFPGLYESLTYLLPDLFTSLRIGPFHFQAGGHKRRPNLASVLCLFCYVIYFVTGVCLLLLCLI